MAKKKTKKGSAAQPKLAAPQAGLSGFNVLEHEQPTPARPQKSTVNGTSSPGPSPPGSFPPSTHAQPPPTPPATPPPTERTPQDTIRQACDLLEVGLSAEAYSLLLSSSSSSPLAPHPSKAAEVERLAGHVSSIKFALREKRFDHALKEWNKARVLWTKESGRGGGKQRGVPWVAKVWKFEALEGARKWGELEKFASDTLGTKPQDRQLVLYYKAQALYQVGKLEDATMAASNAQEAVAGSMVEKVKILADRIRRIRTLKDEGKEAFDAGKYKVAIGKYTDALEVDTGNKAVQALLYVNRGLALYKNDGALQAIEDFTASISRAPTLKAYRLRSLAYRKLEDLSNALNDLIKGASLAPPDSAEKRQIEKERDEVRKEKLKRDAEERREEEEERRWKEKQAKRKDHYGILGIDRNATTTEIRAAYKKLSLETHPDKGGDEERFKEVKASYEFLSDERRRERYDMGDSDAEGPDFDDMFGGGGIPFAFFFSDLFNTYPRSGGRGRGSARGGRR
ncbi:hypothetical protein NBRC10513_006369 [Rhodotorula toruloides]|uniref:BY PROTMAP: gi/472580966/gb/EMS18727.1/ protein of heat shock protein DnaJ family [Rhodosporidium toruloides NP11] gi/647402692/emb/CDR48907.1/ RHTO0S21e01376g1_1 [Rhodosporidium toruloides] n=1 Tax=Rhodotorula toruloides TaxID=5286 RepID=A0A0K3CNU7_RHOTO|nr:hypothetical protein AAT19DRAFT_16348 [Rhodotorula toruloides]